MPFNIQGPELIVLLVIALLILGPGKLPEVGSALGRSIREFRKAATDVKDATSLEPAKPASPPATAPAAPPAPPIPAQAAAPAAAEPTAAPSPSGAGPSGQQAVAAAPSSSDADSPAS